MMRSHSSLRFSRSCARPLYVLLVLVLAIGMGACDSTGTNGEGGENGDNGENGEDVAQTFEVTVQSIDGTDYPYADQNNVGVAYAIDGEVGKVITLERGQTYAFELQSSVESGPNSMSHPFYVGDTAEGQGGDEFSDGVENANATTGTVTFTPPTSAPDSLYYQCGAHVYMGGKMMIEDGTSGNTGTGGGGDDGGGY